MTAILILNGPNLNLLGTRQPEVYGRTTLSDIQEKCKIHAQAIGIEIEFQQSNHEGALLDHLHASRDKHDGVVLNAGAYTHTSVALYDAIIAIEIPVIELHLSNVHARESFRHHSTIAAAVIGQVCGFGVYGYIMALDALSNRLGGTSA